MQWIPRILLVEESANAPFCTTTSSCQPFRTRLCNACFLGRVELSAAPAVQLSASELILIFFADARRRDPTLSDQSCNAGSLPLLLLCRSKNDCVPTLVTSAGRFSKWRTLAASAANFLNNSVVYRCWAVMWSCVDRWGWQPGTEEEGDHRRRFRPRSSDPRPRRQVAQRWGVTSQVTCRPLTALHFPQLGFCLKEKMSFLSSEAIFFHFFFRYQTN